MATAILLHLHQKQEMNILTSMSRINTFILDVDGVLTNGNILVLESGEMARQMNVKDGYALQLAIKKGYRIFIVSGSSPSAVERRLNNLGIQDIFFKVQDKRKFIEKLIQQYQLNEAEILFMGDDMPDLPVFKTVGLCCCPADAIPEIRDAADYISPQKGGEGCVREVIEKVMKINGDWGVSTAVAST